MSLTSRFRKFAIFAFLALFLPAWAPGGLPLVWCVGSNGHNAVEMLGLGDCHRAPTPGFRDGNSGAEKAGCTDFSLWRKAQLPREPVVAAPPPPPDPATPAAFTVAIHGNPGCRLPLPRSQPDSIANQLAQLRTVVLLI
ncbi:hypothetical protein [Methyloceanibacter sp.]|uniref:hypothetical protein n=1 Tax=Methyloceanibacter sp. TaxID=1965321 RepID=UPI002C0F9B00|nr:hypothetical protein [Methyloceanibacter sp.]HML92996.1 hypothetical protein [Methyloceanibacter sp.]